MGRAHGAGRQARSGELGSAKFSGMKKVSRRGRRGRTLALLGLGLECLGVLGYAGLGAARVLGGEVEYRGTAIGIVGFIFLIGFALAALVVALWRWRRWAVAPGITVQLFVVFALAWPLLQQGQGAYGAALLVLAAVTGYGLVLLVPELPRAGASSESDTGSGAKAT